MLFLQSEDPVNVGLQPLSILQFIDVPVTDLKWDVRLPTGYRVIRAEGSVVPVALDAPKPALQELMSWLGGVDWRHGWIGLAASGNADRRTGTNPRQSGCR